VSSTLRLNPLARCSSPHDASLTGNAEVRPTTWARYYSHDTAGHGDNTPLNGRISEVVIASWALSQAEYQLYRTDAQSKWGGL
jgi:hypothetical protein